MTSTWSQDCHVTDNLWISPILHKPIVLSVFSSISNCKDTVVQLGLAALLRVIHPVLVQLREGGKRGERMGRQRVGDSEESGGEGTQRRVEGKGPRGEWRGRDPEESGGEGTQRRVEGKEG